MYTKGVRRVRAFLVCGLCEGIPAKNTGSRRFVHFRRVLSALLLPREMLAI